MCCEEVGHVQATAVTGFLIRRQGVWKEQRAQPCLSQRNRLTHSPAPWRTVPTCSPSLPSAPTLPPIRTDAGMSWKWGSEGQMGLGCPKGGLGWLSSRGGTLTNQRGRYSVHQLQGQLDAILGTPWRFLSPSPTEGSAALPLSYRCCLSDSRSHPAFCLVTRGLYCTLLILIQTLPGTGGIT